VHQYNTFVFATASQYTS